MIQKLDLGSFKSIREFAKNINESESKLDLLVHNAGFFSIFETVESADYMEQSMAVNYFGPFLLTHLLVGLLLKADAARIIFVTSSLYTWGNINYRYLNAIGKWPIQLYCDSKFAVYCFAQELALRLKSTTITVNCVNPGAVNTEMYKNVPWIMETLGFRWLRNKYWKTPYEGCQSILYTAISEELDYKTGQHIEFNRLEPIHPKALDYEFNRQVWDATRKICYMKPTDPKINCN